MIGTAGSIGRLVFEVLATPAAFERDAIVERTKAGLAAVRARGRRGRRPRMMTKAKSTTAMAMMADQDNAASDVADPLGASRPTRHTCVDGRGRPRSRAAPLLAAERSRAAQQAVEQVCT